MRIFAGNQDGGCARGWRAIPICLLLFGQSLSAETQSVELIARKAAEDTLVKVVFEVDGHVLTEPATKNAEPIKHPLKAVGNFLYEERVIDLEKRQSVRFYQQASAQLSVDRKPRDLELRDNRRYMTIDPHDDTDQFQALEGPLTRDELELIEVPGGSHVVDLLLSGRETKVGEEWSVADDVIQRVLNLNAVNANDVKVKLVSIEDSQAKLELAGTVLGGLHGVMTEVRLKGKLTFDTKSRSLSWVALGIDESREVGLALPGLKVNARLRLLRQDQPAARLGDEAIQSMLSGVAQASGLLQLYPGSEHFALTHDRHWHLYRNHPDLVVLRRVIDNKMVGQVNIRPLPPLPVGQQVSLESFRQEVLAALVDSSPQIVDATETQTPNQSRQLRVSVVGQVAGVPIHWIYYQLAFDESRRVTCVFTTSGQDLELFGAEDISLINQLDLRPNSTTAEESDDVARQNAPVQSR